MVILEGRNKKIIPNRMKYMSVLNTPRSQTTKRKHLLNVKTDLHMMTHVQIWTSFMVIARVHSNLL